MNDEFFVWAAKIEPNATVLVDMNGFKKSYELETGVPQLESYPTEVTLQMDSRKPSNTTLVDNIKNIEGVVIISEKMKLFIERRELSDVEFLPITLLDIKGQKRPESYYIFHPINNVVCLDLRNAEPEWDDIDDTVVASVKHLVIDKSKVIANRLFFRPKNYLARPIVAKALVDELLKEGFTGVQFLPVSEVSGYLR